MYKTRLINTNTRNNKKINNMIDIQEYLQNNNIHAALTANCKLKIW